MNDINIDLKKPKCTDKTWEGHTDCVRCAIRNHVLFSGIPEEQLDHLVSPIKNITYPANSVIYRAEEKSNAIYTIRKGLIKLVQHLPNGSERTVRLVQNYDAMGLESVLKEPYHHTAITLQKTELCQIPLSVITALEKTQPQLGRQLMHQWQNHLDNADKFIIDFSTGPAETRVARLLLFLRKSSNSLCFNKIGREDIASILGITTETASRIMADLKRRSIINCIPGECCTCEPERLYAIANSMS